MKKPLLIGISGGTGSGKTSFMKQIIKAIDEDSIIQISQDSYYKDLSDINYNERCKINFDHPDSIDFLELIKDLKELINNNDVKIPIYDYKKHVRKKERQYLKTKPIIIIEGIFSLYNLQIRDLIDIKIFVDTPSDIRVLRRVKRDINKRGRLIESIVSQYIDTVRPMHQKFIEPTKEYADIIVPNGGKNKVALDIINSQLLPIINERIKHVNS